MDLSKSRSPRKIIIFASGSGTNAENIIKYFKDSNEARVIAVFSNNKAAKALKKAHALKVKALHFDREAFYHSNEVLHVLEDLKPDIIVLAGFLWLFPNKILRKFPKKVINLHPALLPKFGGKGMYGEAVHKAVIKEGESETGITIHYVNENYDEGNIIFQAKIPVEDEMSHEKLAEKIHQLEYRHFPTVIKNTLEHLYGE